MLTLAHSSHSSVTTSDESLRPSTSCAGSRFDRGGAASWYSCGTGSSVRDGVCSRVPVEATCCFGAVALLLICWSSSSTARARLPCVSNFCSSTERVRLTDASQPCGSRHLVRSQDHALCNEYRKPDRYLGCRIVARYLLSAMANCVRAAKAHLHLPTARTSRMTFP